jgi:acetyl-CoA acyltransferase
VVSERMLKELKVQPIARLVSYGVAGVPPRIMGIGPVEAIPKALKLAGMKLDQIDLIELNEAFASQSLAVQRELGINPDVLNVNGVVERLLLDTLWVVPARNCRCSCSTN